MIASLVGPFAEAVRATVQPCTFLLIVPMLAAVAAAGARWHAVLGATVAGIVGGWLLADNRFLLEGAWLRASGLLAIVLFALLVIPGVRDEIPGERYVGHARGQAGIVAAVTLLATMWWRPCVGEELGVILNGAQDGLVGQLLPMASYMLGALVPVAVVVAARYVAEPPVRVSNVIDWAFASIGIVVAGSLVAGQHDEVVVRLTRWTLE